MLASRMNVRATLSTTNNYITADTNDSVEYSNRPRYNDINLNGARASYLLIIARILDY